MFENLDWQTTLNAVLILAVTVLGAMRQKDKKTWVDTAHGLAETAQEIVGAIKSPKDTKEELDRAGTAQKIQGVKDKVAGVTGS